MTVKSPLTGTTKVKLEKKIKTEFIRHLYQKELKIDVGKYFGNYREISVYRCLDSGYSFYYPFDIAGDNNLYAKLGGIPWYYMDWKWEHETAKDFLKKTDSVLEMGCAHGSFLSRIKKSCHRVVGLETNPEVQEKGQKSGLTIFSETIEEHSLKAENKYNVVCSFQVLEHVWNVRSFLASSCRSLKKDGLLILSVPNSDCLIFKNFDIYLNMPPHHMGLWDINSLIKITDYFPLKLQALEIEPLQSYHLSFAQELAAKGSKSGFLEKYYRQATDKAVANLSNYLIGHSVLAVFTKK